MTTRLLVVLVVSSSSSTTSSRFWRWRPGPNRLWHIPRIACCATSSWASSTPCCCLSRPGWWMILSLSLSLSHTYKERSYLSMSLFDWPALPGLLSLFWLIPIHQLSRPVILFEAVVFLSFSFSALIDSYIHLGDIYFGVDSSWGRKKNRREQGIYL